MSNKETFENFSNRRKQKAPSLPKVVTNESINSLVGDSSFDNWGVSYLDLSEYDFSNVSLETMTKLCFSSSTIWPDKDKLPKGFNPSEILEKSTRTNDLVKSLHNKGIDGSGITIAVIDNRFKGDKHIEFEGANITRCTLDGAEIINYHFHMEDVLAKLCGKNLGIAPKIKVLYYEVSDEEDCSYDVMNALENIKDRIIRGEKIRAINYSYSLTDEDAPFKYQQECIALSRELSQLGCELIDSTRFGEDFFCCGTSFINQEDNVECYNIASFAKNKPYKDKVKEKINILCSGRTILEYCSNTGYKYEVVDCFSWTIPQCVGYYALCLQGNPKLTFKEFTKLSYNSCDVSSNGLRILNIEKLIKKIQLQNKR